MKTVHRVSLRRLAKAIFAMKLNVADLFIEDHKDVNSKFGQLAEDVLEVNNDVTRRVMAKFCLKFRLPLESAVKNVKMDENIPEYILRLAKHLAKLSKKIEDIDSASWRNVDSVFGQLCQLENISKRNPSNRRKMHYHWINPDGKLRNCYQTIIEELRSQDEICTISEPSSEDDEDVPLPPRKTHPTGFTASVIPVGTCKLDFQLDQFMWRNNETMNLAVKEVIESLWPGCVININRLNYNKVKDPLVTGYAYCAHRECRLLFADKAAQSHQGMMSKQLRGLERRLVKRKLAEEHPSIVLNGEVLECDSSKARKGNLQGVRTPDVIKKARSEHMAREDLHKNDIFDVLLMMDGEEKDLIQGAGQPFFVYLWNSKMHKVALSVGRKASKDDSQYTNYLSLDATSSLFKAQKSQPVYLYSGSFKHKSTIYPALDFMLVNQRTEDIVLPLVSYRRSVLDSTGRWPLFTHCVVDDSMALRSAVCEAWNMMSMADYLNEAYVWLKRGSVNKDKVCIMGCASHFAKRLSRGASKFAPMNSTLRKFFIEGFLALTQMKTFEGILSGFKHLTVIFNSEMKSQLLMLALQGLQKSIESTMFKTEDYPEAESSFEEDYKDTLWNGSPLARHLDEIALKELSHIKESSNTGEKNPLFCPDWYAYMKEHFAPKLIFHTAVFLRKNEVSVSNETQENGHRYVKVVMCKNRRNVKPGRFIKMQRRRILALTKLHDLRIGRKPTASKRLQSYQESFKKRLRNKTCHTSLKAVRKIDLSKISSVPIKKCKKTSKLVKSPLKTSKKTNKNRSGVGPSAIMAGKSRQMSTPASGNLSKTVSFLTAEDLAATASSNIDINNIDRVIGTAHIRRSTLRAVKDGRWITDDAINGFIQTRLEVFAVERANEFIVFDTSLTGYADGLSEAAKNFIDTYEPMWWDIWLLPINVSGCHWALFVVLPRQKTILYVDSLHFRAQAEFKTVCRIVQYALFVHGEDYKERQLLDWVAFRCSDVVTQSNQNDCGAFLCAHVQAIFSQTEIVLHPSDGNNLRKWLLGELCEAPAPEEPLIPCLKNLNKKADVDLGDDGTLDEMSRMPMKNMSTAEFLGELRKFVEDGFQYDLLKE